MTVYYQRRKGQKEKSRLVAAFLAFFFGMFGVHKFYLNQTGQGFVFILILIVTSRLAFPITSFLGIIDAFRLFAMSDEQFHHKYNRGAYVNPTHRDDRKDTRSRRTEARNTSRGDSRNSSRNTKQPSRAAIQRSNPFKKSGIKKHRDFDLKGAIIDFNKGLEINPDDIALHYNIANSYSLTEQKEKAYYHLSRAVELGFVDFELLNTKDDLAYVRIQPEWEAFKHNGFKMSSDMMSNSSSKSQNIPIQTDDVLLSQLNKLADLRKKGLLSEEEFVLERKKLMNR